MRDVSKQNPATPEKFEDRYENALVELLNQKRKSEPIRMAAKPRDTGNAVNLMDALRNVTRKWRFGSVRTVVDPCWKLMAQKQLHLTGPARHRVAGPVDRLLQWRAGIT